MFLEEILNNTNNLTTSEKNVLEYILSSEIDITNLKSGELAMKSFSSPATITRMCKKLGFKGFNEFKYFLSKENKFDSEHTNCTHWKLLQNDINSTIDFIDSFNFQDINALLNSASKIYSYGTSWGERNALKMFVRNFLATELEITDIPSVTELEWISRRAKSNDLFIFVSYSGENKNLLSVSKKLKFKKISLISITPIKENSLAKISDQSLYYTSTELFKNSYTDQSDYNLFTTLHILLDAIYRKYIDYKINIEDNEL